MLCFKGRKIKARRNLIRNVTLSGTMLAMLATIRWITCCEWWLKELISSRISPTTLWEPQPLPFYLHKTSRLGKSKQSRATRAIQSTFDQFKQMSTALTSFIHSDRSPEISRRRCVDLSKTKEGSSASISTPHSGPTSSCQNSPPTVEHESVFASLGLNSGSILPPGSFSNCQFTFNVNVNNSRWHTLYIVEHFCLNIPVIVDLNFVDLFI